MSIRSDLEYMVHLDGVRALLIFLVIAEHWGSGLPRLLRKIVFSFDLGGLGVESFFVLSGFLITSILLRNKISGRSISVNLKNFYYRRILRIFPPYYFTLLLLFFFLPNSRGELPWHAMYLSNVYVLKFGHPPIYAGHFWSLAVEEQFYLIWPIVIMITPTRLLKQVVVGFCLIGPVSRLIIYLIGLQGWPTVSLLPTSMDLLCFGSLLACIREEVGLKKFSIYISKSKWVALISVAIYLFIYFYADELIRIIVSRTLVAFFAGFLIASAAQGYNGMVGIVFGNKVVVWVGMVSYGIYIYHIFIPKIYLTILNFLSMDKNIYGIYYIRFPAMCFIMIVLVSLSYYIIEQPIRLLKKYSFK